MCRESVCLCQWLIRELLLRFYKITLKIFDYVMTNTTIYIRMQI